MTVYVDDAFTGSDWGKWTGGGHMQADTPEELHAFAARLDLRRAWFQQRPGRPERDHYDVQRAKRDRAIRLGAVPETVQDGTVRRRTARGALHVDVFKTDPLSSDGPKFLKRIALDDPLMVTPAGPTQVATGRATYACVSEPHTMEDCPYA